MRENLQTATGPTPTAHGADHGHRGEQAEPARPRGVIARLIRGKRTEHALVHAARPSHSLPRDTIDTADRAAPELQGVHKRRISPRPAGFEASLQPDPASADPDTGPEGRPGMLRHKRGLGFALLVVLPLCVVVLYMTAFARPQYTSSVAFTVRSMDTAGMNDALTGFAQFAGATRSTDALILAAFLESQTLLQRLNGRLDLVRHYAAPFDRDPVFALAPSARIEARLTHWRQMLTVQADPATGLIHLQVNAFSPEMAQLIARELLVESRALLNDLNADATMAATAQAEVEFDAARQDLDAARAALTAFRTESRIFDPNSDFEGRVGVLRHLQGQLAQALVEQDLQRPGDNDSDAPRVVALRDRITAERDRMVQASHDGRPDYPELLATHEHLSTERDYAEAAFRTARTARDLALAQAARRDLYLAVFVQPTLPERPDHARTIWAIGLTALFLGLIWTIGTLVRAAVLDRR
jgi:capsular polysaccharide transport system permease protein